MVQRYRIPEDQWNTTTTREFQETYGANDSAKAMGNALKINLTLQTLTLDHNNSGNEGAMAFADGLKINSVLKELGLINNDK